MEETNTANQCLVGVQGETIVILRPVQRLTKAEALVFAAYLVAMADEDCEFDRILEAVQST